MADHEPDHEQPDHIRLREIARELACMGECAMADFVYYCADRLKEADRA